MKRVMMLLTVAAIMAALMAASAVSAAAYVPPDNGEPPVVCVKAPFEGKTVPPTDEIVLQPSNTGDYILDWGALAEE